MNADKRTGFWRRLGSSDKEALKSFLIRHEDYAAGFSGRILRDGEVRIPGLASGGVFGLDGDDSLRGAVLWHNSGAVFPIFDEVLPSEQLEGLGRFFAGGSFVSFLGDARHVDALELSLDARPRVSVAYRSMYLSGDARLPEAPAPQDGACVRSRKRRDGEALFPLHAAYEKEEVVTEIHRFDERLSRASLDHILQSELVAAADLDGRIVAVARTNSRGFRTWQIGGVYVVPELRGRGWGRFVVEYLARLIRRDGKSVGLFVKEGNAPARGLYRSMGFRDVGPYRVDYL